MSLRTFVALLAAGLGLLRGSGALRPEAAERKYRDGPSRGSWSQTCKGHEGKRIVLTTVNKDYFEMFLNWLNYAAPFLKDTEHLHVMAEDEAVVPELEQLLERSPVMFTVTALDWTRPTALLDDPFGTDGYGDVVWKRPDEIMNFLEKGCSVLYTDIDTVWLRDPFVDIGAADAGDLYLTDNHVEPMEDLCTCFMYMDPTPQVKSLMQRWAGARKKNTNQKIFNRVLRDVLHDNAEDTKPQLVTLPFESYPPGNYAPVLPVPPKLSVYHANWLLGIEPKVNFFIERHIWNPGKLAA